MPKSLPFLFLLSITLPAALVRLEVADRHDVLDGQSFGKTGAYEYIRGRAYFEVDPTSAASNRITDIRLVPRNASGKVEFSADVVLLVPKNADAGNGTLLLEPPNRGGMGMLAMYNRAKSSTMPASASHFGDGFLMREGYSLAWVGWQHDIPERAGLLRAHLPTATGVEGLVRGEFTPSAPVQRIPLGDSDHVPYKPNSANSLTLTLRNGINAARSPMPEDSWRLEGTEIVLAKPASPGYTYEFVYRATDPPAAGLGLAAIRDLVQEMKHGKSSVVGGRVRRAIGVGTSQSAMALKALVYEGFNADEKGRIVLDGLQAHVAGGRRSTFERFTQASRTSGPFRNASFSTTDQFPYSDAEEIEPATGRKDSLIARAKAVGVTPRIIYTNSSYEYWGSAGSLVHTSLDGKRDLTLPATTRVYLLAGGQHGPAPFPPKPGSGKNLPNWNDYRWIIRAVLVNLNDWVTKGKEPPPSVYPTVGSKTLTKGTPPAYGTQFLDFGPEYLSKGVISRQPPVPGAEYAVLVPAHDTDGNDVVGIKMPWVAVPLGTFTGWNLRTASMGAEGGLLANTGSYLPFSERRIRKAFPDRAAYARKIEDSARRLVRQHFLLEADVAPVIAMGEQIWDWATSPAAISAFRSSSPASAQLSGVE